MDLVGFHMRKEPRSAVGIAGTDPFTLGLALQQECSICLIYMYNLSHAQIYKPSHRLQLSTLSLGSFHGPVEAKMQQ